MLIKVLLILLNAGVYWTAPIENCGGSVECMYRKLQRETENVKPPPCKRMFTRPGKRSVEEVECLDDDIKSVERPTMPDNKKRVFIERLLRKLEDTREVDESWNMAEQESGEEGNSMDAASDKASDNNLQSQVSLLRSKIAEMLVSSSSESEESESSENVEISDFDSSEDISQMLQKVKESMSKIEQEMPVVDKLKHTQVLHQLSQRPVEGVQVTVSPSRTPISATQPPSKQKPSKNPGSKIDSPNDVIRRLIEDSSSQEREDSGSLEDEETSEFKIPENVQQRLQKVREDIDRILPLMPEKKDSQSSQVLQRLSQRLNEEMKVSTTQPPSAQDTNNNLGSKVDSMIDVINRLIEVDKTGYNDLKSEIEQLNSES